MNKPVLMENAAEMETKPEQELSTKQNTSGTMSLIMKNTLIVYRCFYTMCLAHSGHYEATMSSL